MTPRTFLQNASIRHQIFVQRFGGGLNNKYQVVLDRILKKLTRQLRSNRLTRLSKARLTKVYQELDSMMSEEYKKFSESFIKDLVEFGKNEAEFSAKMFDKVTNENASFDVPSVSLINTAVMTRPLLRDKDRLKIATALTQLSRRKRKEVLKRITDGVITGKTNKDIVDDVEYVVNKVQRRHLESVIRTSVNQVTAEARQVVMNENSDVLEGVEWVSTLDGSTTATCQSLDGKKFPIDSGPRPPIHWNCRSVVIPTVLDEYSIKNIAGTERPAIGAKGVENVHGNTTYNSWLKRQPASFQDEVLGPTKGKLFREGGLNVGAFVDNNYQPLTLEQLRRTNPMAFEKAGLNE